MDGLQTAKLDPVGFQTIDEMGRCKIERIDFVLRI